MALILDRNNYLTLVRGFIRSKDDSPVDDLTMGLCLLTRIIII